MNIVQIVQGANLQMNEEMKCHGWMHLVRVQKIVNFRRRALKSRVMNPLFGQISDSGPCTSNEGWCLIYNRMNILDKVVSFLICFPYFRCQTSSVSRLSIVISQNHNLQSRTLRPTEDVWHKKIWWPGPWIWIWPKKRIHNPERILHV